MTTTVQPIATAMRVAADVARAHFQGGGGILVTLRDEGPVRDVYPSENVLRAPSWTWDGIMHAIASSGEGDAFYAVPTPTPADEAAACFHRGGAAPEGCVCTPMSTCDVCIDAGCIDGDVDETERCVSCSADLADNVGPGDGRRCVECAAGEFCATCQRPLTTFETGECAHCIIG